MFASSAKRTPPPIKVHHESVLFITIDSCRFDVFNASTIPNMRKVGAVHRAMAPGYFTYGSHAAMFMGFTPGVAGLSKPFINPKYGKIFKMDGGGFSGPGAIKFILKGKNIIDGFKNRGYRCLGTGAVGWFDPSRETSRVLTDDFHEFYYPGNTWSLESQLEWLANKLDGLDGPVFAFINIGETHIPYYYDGAPWGTDDPCRQIDNGRNDARECRRRQQACLEYIDAKLAPLLEAFAEKNILICADHGDAWGEYNLWGHGMHHEKVLEVPLIYNLTKHYDSQTPFFQRLIKRKSGKVAP